MLSLSWLVVLKMEYVKLQLENIWVGSFSCLLACFEDSSWLLYRFHSEYSCLGNLWEYLK